MFRTDHVRKFYPETQQSAVEDVSLKIMTGEFVGIKGPSGSGKSTLLYLLAGLIEPSGGEIYFFDKPLAGIHNKALFRRQNLGFMFQDFYLYPHFTVLENMLFPLLYQMVIPKAVVQK